MPKALCITGIAISVLLLVLFLTDLIMPMVLGLIGMEDAIPYVAPFRGASYLMDIFICICAGGLGYLSWTTFKEQV